MDSRLNRPLGILTISLLLVASLALVGCGSTIVQAPEGQNLGTVTASGTGKASATPDQATMSFGVTTQNKDAKKALDEASKTAGQISTAVQQAGVDKKDIQTQNVSVYPTYGADGSEITGYQASLSVSVIVRDLANLSDVISAATNAGASNISGPAFGVEDDTVYRQKAIDEAVADARKGAEAMAKAAGKSVGEVLRISTGDTGVQPVPMASAELNAKDAAVNVPIEPGQLDITASVTVVFALK
jgi:hypothetical protein